MLGVGACDCAVDLEVAEHALDPVALAIEALAVADGRGAVGFRRDDRFDPALLQVGSDRISVVGFICEKSIRRRLGKIGQRVVGRAIRRPAGLR